MDADKPDSSSSKEAWKPQLVWKNVILFILLHAAALYGAVLFFRLKLVSIVFYSIYIVPSGLGITAGAHRLWAHRSYKASLPLRIFLMIANCIAMQNSIYVWARDHRVHHKFTESPADPHDATRGFFFSHMGWLLVKKHPDVTKYGKHVNLSDLLNDPVVAFQKRHYMKLALLFCFVVPTVVPLLWGEDLKNAYFALGVLRYVWVLHSTWLVNSAAHMWGMRPYDKNIQPRENYAVSWFAIGEGFHNYHHTFPFDYRTSEFGGGYLNVTTLFIDTWVKLGLASHCRRPADETIQRRSERTGEVAYKRHGN
eukprot:m.309171 g.309171  ORF g.309171 m.309171 type:complete len:310 (+) comp45687_c0_seq1:51-980(+)